MFQRGDIVWGKMKSYPWWPAMVLSPEDVARKGSKNKVWMFWFGDHKHSEVDRDKISIFKACFSRNVNKSTGKLFRKAIEEVLHLLAFMHGLQFQDVPSLLKWANSEFQSSVPVSFRWDKSDLPQIVEKAVSKSAKTAVTDDSSDSDTDSDDELKEVLKGVKTLEDICISCCKKNRKIISPHPLFIGNVCIHCKKYVNKACKLPAGQMQDLCIVCGQGGALVYCSNSLCFRSFCKICIESMASEEEFAKVLEDDNWLCYLCEVTQNKKCLIKRRTTHQANNVLLPLIPKSKSPISVLALNETGLKAIKKAHMKVKNYLVAPQSENIKVYLQMEYSSKYNDFSFKEIKEISADLILGSFFTGNEVHDRKNCVTMFFLKFYRFLFRLDITRLFNLNVFFIFMSEANIVDENISSRVMRFLMVSPVSVNFGVKKILVWSNFSGCLIDKAKNFKKETYTDSNTAEEKIMYPFMKFLQKYFELE